MSKKRPRTVSFAAVLESLGSADPDDGPDVLSPAGSGEIVDADGCRWAVSRGPLDVRLAKRLVRSADVMIVGESAGDRQRPVPARERDAAWARIKDRIDSDGLPSYQPYEFASADGRKLLYIEQTC
ncbi:hypothetical protein NLX86_11370 [Streptomyces sp. A3M-1-3]|uniref:hypothetical protein n=1 Tax=Streptomyces sp. A3M-1-3 TaxID=2962044 RepID=UPI0020B8AC68|nr:hypothetical protein [Streptomyces sp. A3M-1-3]MCP3818694.1 hypothetical protein [Streptomyces sp. A3M-1-3]